MPRRRDGPRAPRPATPVFDGGTDGDADTTADNSLLAVQGLFVP